MRARMLPAVAAAIVALAACGGDEQPGATDARFDAAQGGACDAAPVLLCSEADCDGICVNYEQESGFDSCTDYDACVETGLLCPAGTCSADCEAALCPAEWTCDPTATGRFTCTKP